MSKSRRQFLTHTSIGLIGTAVVACSKSQKSTQPAPSGTPDTPGAPPAFGTAPGVGPEVSPSTFAEAEKLVEVELTGSERAQAAGNWRSSMAPLYERRVGPRKIAIAPTVAPYSRWDPILPAEKTGPHRDLFVRAKSDPAPHPAKDADIAFAPPPPP